MNISVTEPISKALDRTRLICFSPFDLSKWFGLGFCAWLALLGEQGGASYNGNFNTGRGGGALPPEIQNALNWMQSNLWFTFGIFASAILFLVLVGFIFTWLKCRGVFMFVDGLANNRGLVRQPWTEYRDRANALFKFHVLLALFNYLISIAVMALLLFLAQSDIQSLTFTNSSITAIVVAVLFFLPYGILMVILNLALRDFVMPAMYLRNVGVLDAWQIARAEVISGNAGSIILFYLMRFLLGIAAGVITVVVTLITCCILGCIPFIWAVVFLPLLAFDRLYLMCFLEQFGPNWKFFKDDHTVEIQPMYMEPALDVPPATQPPPPAL